MSSGARAAAQTLNVPIERLESRQSNHREHGNAVNNHNDVAAMTSASGHEINVEKSVAMQHGRHSIDTEVDVHQDAHHILDSEAESTTVNADRHQFTKQSSYLHPVRKTSNTQQQHTQQHQLQHGSNHVSMSHQLDANYLTEEPNGSSGPSPSVTKYSLLQFAMQHFRNE